MWCVFYITSSTYLIGLPRKYGGLWNLQRWQKLNLRSFEPSVRGYLGLSLCSRDICCRRFSADFKDRFFIRIQIIIITNDNICCHHSSMPLREFTWFIWWIWHGAKRPPTFRPGQMTRAVSPSVGCQKPHSPSPFIITQLKIWYHFTILLRVEGWVDLSTAVRVCSPCPRLYIAVVFTKNNCYGGIRTLVISHWSQACYCYTTVTKLLFLLLGSLAENRLWQVERRGRFRYRWIERWSIRRRMLILYIFCHLLLCAKCEQQTGVVI